MRSYERRMLVLGLSLMLAGCSAMMQGEPGDIVSGGPFPIIERLVYNANAPDAVMTLEEAGDGVQRGTIRGLIHGWPFAHSDAGGDFGEGLFTDQVEFEVTARESQNARLPSSARGTRTVYFHPDRGSISIAQADAFSAGQPVITDSVELSFSFDQAAKTVAVTMVLHQSGVKTFTWKGQEITPPRSAVRTVQASGNYSAQLGGYVFTSAM
ncbi:MAG: hypothetical protein ACYDC3_06245 [Candidatus Binataceae bacterium]